MAPEPPRTDPRTPARVHQALRRRNPLLFEAAPFGIVFQDADGHVFSANLAAERILGLSLTQLQGRTSVDPRWQATHEDGSPFHGETHPAMAALRTGAPAEGIMGVFNPRTERTTWIQISSVPLFLPGEGRPHQVMSTFLDITERKVAELALAQSERTYRNLFSGLLNGAAYCRMLYVDGRPDDFVYLAVNEAFQAQTGLKDVIGRKVSEVIPGIQASDPGLLELYGRVARTGRPEHFEGFLEALQMWFQVSVFSPEKDHFVAVFDVITERKSAEKLLRDREERLRLFVEHTPAAIAMMDTAMRYLVVSRRWLEDYHLGERQILGLSHYEVFPDIPERWREIHRRCLAGAVESCEEDPFPRADGTTDWVRWEIRPWHDAEGAIGGIIIFSEVITGRVRAQLENRTLQNQLLQSQKMEGLGSLAGGIAHDVNNVLGAILALASVHQLNAPEGSPLRRDLETIARACERGGSMVKSLLTFARTGLSETRAVDLNALVREQAALLARTTLQKVQVALDLAQDLRPVRGDPSALTHALMNLCVNAVDAMPGGGTLTLRTANGNGDQVQLEVADTGCGMDPAVMDKALEPFFTTKPEGKGTGLGLSLVYGTVKAHHGTLSLQSAPGQGTKVAIHLPAIDPAPADDHGRSGPEASGAGLRVLLVDDDELIQNSVIVLLEALGHRTLLARDGRQALELAASGQPLDVVILDMNMPGMSGAETLPPLRALRPGLPVLLATGRADQAALDLTHSYPAVTLLAKPFSLEELKARLKGI